MTQDANDRRQLRPMLVRAQENLAAAGAGRRIGTVLADAGYWSDLEIEPLIAPADRPSTPGRPQICESVCGQIKWVRGTRRFMRRGLAAGDAEWKLRHATDSLRKLRRAKAAAC